MISMNCPNCGHGLKIKDKYGGQQGRCKHCRTKFTVPEAPPSDAETIALSVGEEYAQPSPSEIDRRLDSTSFEEIAEGETPAKADDPMGLGTPPPVSPRAVSGSAYSGLGCTTWGLAFFLPPIGLFMALIAPNDHPQRGLAIVTSSLMLLVALACLGGGAMLAASVPETVAPPPPPSAATPAPRDALEPVREPEPATDPTPTPTPTPVAAGNVPSYPFLDVRLTPGEPVAIEEGALSTVDQSELAFWQGTITGEFTRIPGNVDVAMRSGGWAVSATYGYDATRGGFATIAGTKGAESVYLEFIETPTGASVTVVTRR